MNTGFTHLSGRRAWTSLAAAVSFLAACEEVPTGPLNPGFEVEDVLSDFETDLEGWEVIGGPAPIVHTAQARIGSQSIYSHEGSLHWFRAPHAFLGDKSPYYGGELTHWYQWSNPSSRASPRTHLADVELVGANGVTLRYIDPAGPPAAVRTWQLNRVRLDETGGWVHADGRPADREDIEEVLEDLADLLILADRRVARDNDYIDHVRMRAAT